MATQTILISVGLNSSGAAADPNSCAAVVTAPDGTSHSTPTPAKNTAVGTGAYQAPVVISDADAKGVYTCWFKPVFGANTLIIPVPFKVE